MYTRRSSTHTRLRHPTEDERTRGPASASAAPSGAGQGRWGRLPADSASEEQPLKWEPVLSLGERIRNSISVPAAIGTVMFAIVVITTAFVMIRGFAADAELHVPEAQQLPFTSEGAKHSEAPVGEHAQPDSKRTSADDPIFVHIVGEVVASGVLELPQGARVVDAIEAAGGATPFAKLDAINLARVLSDGEHVMIPDAESADLAAQPAIIGLPDAPLGAPEHDGKINLNTATAEQLQELHRVGPALANRILDWREVNGNFSSIEDLLEVSGIGPKTLEQFRDRVTV